jgi:hypothetical protein
MEKTIQIYIDLFALMITRINSLITSLLFISQNIKLFIEDIKVF